MNELINKVSYKFFEENRYTITEFEYDKIDYTAICNNGFTKFYSNKCKAYWLSQNELSHLTPDWKFHVSVDYEDLPKAWDIIVKVLLKNKFRTGVKTVYLKENSMVRKGREITVYIYKYIEDYSHSPIAIEYSLSYSDEHSEDFWLNIFKLIEGNLKENGIRSNGLAVGDLKIGDYISLRNEAYIYSKIEGVHEYPPDIAGWNPANHDLPFNLARFIKRNQHEHK